MGKVRTRILGVEQIEEKQKKEQKLRSQEKKTEKKKVRAPGQKGGEKMVTVEADEGSLAKMEKAKEIIETSAPKTADKAKPIEKKTSKPRHRGRKYTEAKKKLEEYKRKKTSFTLEEAVKMLKSMQYAQFDQSVEIHLKVDKVGHRGEIDMPNPTGKALRVKIMDDTVLRAIEKGNLDFDILISHPSYMPKLVKYAKLLGPRGLMPNPKTGTISTQPEETFKKFSKGTVRWKTEPKFPLIHQMVAKNSSPDKDIIENVTTLLKSIGRPHITKAFIKTTMSPSIQLDLESI